MKHYAVRAGRSPGIYDTWEECQAQTNGFMGAQFKKFTSRKDAMAFLAGNIPAGNSKTTNAVISGSIAELHNDEGHAPKEQDDGGNKDNDIITTTQSSAGSSVLTVYTDGSCIRNGKPGSSASIGVFFSHGNKRNISERLKGEPQTNQRAELTAILRALEVAPNKQPLQIVSDSMYQSNQIQVQS